MYDRSIVDRGRQLSASGVIDREVAEAAACLSALLDTGAEAGAEQSMKAVMPTSSVCREKSITGI
jgi:hypothetical protein